MEEMISMSINLHLFMIVATILLALYSIYVTKNIKNDVTYINRIKYIQPQYLSLVSAIVFTGITVMAVNHFVLKPSLVIMIGAILWIYFTSTKLHLIRKMTNTNSIESISDFREYVKRKYTIDIIVMIAVVGISFLIR